MVAKKNKKIVRRKRKKRIRYDRIFKLLLFVIFVIVGLFFLLKFIFKDPYIELGYSKEASSAFKNFDKEVQEIIKNDNYDSRYYEVMLDKKYQNDKAKEYVEFIKESSDDVTIKDILYCVNSGFDYKYFLELKDNRFSKDPYYLMRNYERYKSYSKQKGLDSSDSKDVIRDVVASVNCNVDRPYYQDVNDTDISKDTLMLVNKYYKLPQDYQPPNLISYDFEYGRDLIREDVYDYFKNMADDVRKQGMRIYANSSFRNYRLQNELYDEYNTSYGKEFADRQSARAGHSEHQTGLVIDIIAIQEDGGIDAFEFTKEYKWMQKHAHEYGFIQHYKKGQEKYTGYMPEAWHYRFVGKEVAKYLYEHPETTFDEYYEFFIKGN